LMLYPFFDFLGIALEAFVFKFGIFGFIHKSC